jgi:hypothetical protein
VLYKDAIGEAISEAMDANGNPAWMFDVEIVSAFLAREICRIIRSYLVSGFRSSIMTESGVMDYPLSAQEKRKLLRLRRRLIKNCLAAVSAQCLLRRLDEIDKC